MKQSSARLWIFVAAVTLLLAGVVLVYVIQYPPLPPGWTMHEDDHYRVALPPGKGFSASIHPSSHYYVHSGDPDGDVWIHSVDVSWREPHETPDVILDAYLADMASRPHSTVERTEAISVNGRPARLCTTINRGEPWRSLVVVGTNWLHEVRMEIIPGVFTEEDTDILIRSFRPK